MNWCLFVLQSRECFRVISDVGMVLESLIFNLIEAIVA